MSNTSLGQGVAPRAPDLGDASPKHDPQAELLAAAEEALAWMRDCTPMPDEERWDREADIRVRLRHAIRGVRRA